MCETTLQNWNDGLPIVGNQLIEGRRVEFNGTPRMFDWHIGQWAHQIVIMALMSLERYLYEIVERKIDVVPVIAQLLQAGRSAAFLSVLWDLARRFPELADTHLLPLISSWDLHQWDLRCVSSKPHRIGTMPFNADELEFNRSQKWINMPHREISLTDISVRNFLFKRNNEEFYKLCRELWAEKIINTTNLTEDENNINLFILRFTRSSYVNHQENGQDGYEFQPNDSVQKKMLSDLRKAENNIFSANVTATCAQVLEGNRRTPDSMVLYGAIKKLRTQISEGGNGLELPGQDVRESIRDFHSSIIACAAVLYNFHGDWLMNHPDAWANRALLHKKMGDVPASVSDYAAYQDLLNSIYYVNPPQSDAPRPASPSR